MFSYLFQLARKHATAFLYIYVHILSPYQTSFYSHIYIPYIYVFFLCIFTHPLSISNLFLYIYIYIFPIYMYSFYIYTYPLPHLSHTPLYIYTNFQKSPIISGSFAKRDLQYKAPFAVPPGAITRTRFFVYIRIPSLSEPLYIYIYTHHYTNFLSHPFCRVAKRHRVPYIAGFRKRATNYRALLRKMTH